MGLINDLGSARRHGWAGLPGGYSPCSCGGAHQGLRSPKRRHGARVKTGMPSSQQPAARTHVDPPDRHGLRNAVLGGASRLPLGSDGFWPDTERDQLTTSECSRGTGWYGRLMSRTVTAPPRQPSVAALNPAAPRESARPRRANAQGCRSPPRCTSPTSSSRRRPDLPCRASRRPRRRRGHSRTRMRREH